MRIINERGSDEGVTEPTVHPRVHTSDLISILRPVSASGG